MLYMPYLGVHGIGWSLEEQNFSGILNGVIFIVVVPISIWLFWRPQFLLAVRWMQYLVALRSAERLSNFFLKHGEHVEGMVKVVEMVSDKRVIQYAYFPRAHPGTKPGEYITSSQVDIPIGAMIHVFHVNNLSIVL